MLDCQGVLQNLVESKRDEQVWWVPMKPVNWMQDYCRGKHAWGLLIILESIMSGGEKGCLL